MIPTPRNLRFRGGHAFVRRPLASMFVSAAFLTSWEGGVARAEPISDPGATTTIGPIVGGSTVSQGSAGYGPAGIGAGAGSTTSLPVGPSSLPAGQLPPQGSGYTYRLIPGNELPGVAAPTVGPGGVINAFNPIGQPACPPGQTGYFVYDPTGAFVQVLCVAASGPGPAPAPVPSPLELAQQASDSQPWPELRISVNPAVGLTGLDSWFWFAGSPDMPDATASAGPMSVTVTARLTGVDWDFGDGVHAFGGVGQAFPEASDVEHVYQTDSYGLGSGYPLAATVSWEVTYSVNGGPPQVLGTKTRTYSADYAVEQVQPQGVEG